MLDALARLVDRRRWAVLAASVAVVLAAGAFGGPVVGLLDTGDDFSDPRSESILARDTIERTTGRSAEADAIVLVRLGAEAGTPAAERKLAAVRARIEDDDVAAVRAPERSRPSPLVSEDRRSVYLPVTFYTAADEDAAADALVDRLRGRAGRDGRRRGRGVQPGRRAGGGRPPARRADRRADPAAVLAARLPQPGRRAAAARGRDGDRAADVLRAADRQQLRADVDVRHQPHDGARPRPGDRLLAVHGLALPRGARGGRRPLAGAARDRAHRRPDRALLRLHGRRGARRDARLRPALPLLDGRRRRARGPQRRARLADAAAGPAGGAGPAGERARPAALAGRDAARRRARPGGPVVPALARRDAPPRAGRDRRGGAADRDGAAVPADRVHRRRRLRAAAGEVRARGRRRDPRGVPARPDGAAARGRRSGGARPRARRRTTGGSSPPSTAWRA